MLVVRAGRHPAGGWHPERGEPSVGRGDHLAIAATEGPRSSHATDEHQVARLGRFLADDPVQGA